MRVQERLDPPLAFHFDTGQGQARARQRMRGLVGP